MGKIDHYLGWISRMIWSNFLEIEQEKIVFISFSYQYNCNLKYICDELLRQTDIYRIIWFTKDDKHVKFHHFPPEIELVKIGSIEAIFHQITARIIVENAYISQEILRMPKKRGQTIFQTWHGSLGIKKFGPGEDKIKSRVKSAKRAGGKTDYFISNSTFETEKVASVFWGKANVLEFGHARNDLLFRDDRNTCDLFKKTLGISADTRVVLYAPTFRDDREKDYNILDFEMLISSLENKFGGNWVVLVKLHFSNRAQQWGVETSDRIINVTQYNDIQKLMLVADVGITDYSSWVFDFMLQKKLVIIFAEDQDMYQQERGFYYPLTSTPFIIVHENSCLEEKIMNMDLQEYKKEVDVFLKEKGCIEDGNASKRVAERIIFGKSKE